MDSRLVGLSVLHVPTDILGLVAQAIVLYKYVRRLCLADSRAESSNRATNLESTKSQIDNWHGRADLLRALASRLTEQNFLEEMLLAAQKIEHEQERLKVLKSLAPFLSPPSLEKALKVAQSIVQVEWQSQAIASLALRHAELGLYQEALTTVRGIVHTSCRSNTLVELMQYVPKADQLPILIEALDVAQTINDEASRVETSVNLLPHLPERERPDVLARKHILISAIEGWEYDDGRHKSSVLGTLASYLPQAEQDAMFVEALERIGKIKIEDWRQTALLGLAPYVSDELLRKILKMSRDLPEQYWFGKSKLQARTLARLIPLLAERGYVNEALAEVKTIKDAYWKAKVLKELASYLPEFKRHTLLIESLTTAQTINYENYEDDESLAWVELLSQLLVMLDYPQKALAKARGLPTIYGYSKDNPQGSTLARLLPLLAERGYVNEALTEAKMITDAYWRMEALIALLPYLTNGKRSSILSDALTAARSIQLKRKMRILEQFEDWANDMVEDDSVQARALVRIAPHMPEEERATILDEALSAARAIDWSEARAIALAGIALHSIKLGFPLKSLDIAQTIEKNEERAEALTELIPFLSNLYQNNTITEALATIQRIESTYFRANVLKSLVWQLKNLPFNELYPFWCKSVHILASCTRDDVLRVIPALASAIVDIDRRETVAAISRSIDEVGDWFS